MMGYLMRDLRDIYKLVLAVRDLVRNTAQRRHAHKVRTIPCQQSLC